MSKVLVTGGSGFVGAHVILQLARAGHQVSTTVRNLGRELGMRFRSCRVSQTEPFCGVSFSNEGAHSHGGWSLESMWQCIAVESGILRLDPF